MTKHSPELIARVRELRAAGKTYGEINRVIRTPLSRSTLSYMVRDVTLPRGAQRRVAAINEANLTRGRQLGTAANTRRRDTTLVQLQAYYRPIAGQIKDRKIAKLALATLFITTRKQGLTLSSPNPRLVVLFLGLLKKCFDFNIIKVRCTVQCRMGQDTGELESYWQKVTGVPKRLFYQTQVDPRTTGKRAIKPDYKGVLRVDYLDQGARRELEVLADLICESCGPEGN